MILFDGYVRRRAVTVLASLTLLLYGVSFSLAVRREIPLEYDGNGNLVSDGMYYYEFSGWNRLRRVRLGDASGPVVEAVDVFLRFKDSLTGGVGC